MVLIGSISGRFPGAGRYLFGLGASVASIAWFFSLGFAGQVLAPLFARRTAWRILDGIICLIMWGLAAKLVAEAL